MAAFTAPCATTNITTSTPSKTAQQRQGIVEEACKCENVDDVGQKTIFEKTREFFQMCDIKNKGFITRHEMQRLNGKLPLSVEELENVFDTLDSDSNGYLTLDEFSSGFSDFLFGQRVDMEESMAEETPSKSPEEVMYQNHWEENLERLDEDEEGKHFGRLMESLGANCVFEDPADVRSLWVQLRREEPHLLSNFEDFLARVTAQILEANQEKREMESALQRKVATHDNEIQHLYEEMEQQIKNEKDKIEMQDYERFLSRSQDMMLQLSSKEKELELLFQKQRGLENQYKELHSEQYETKVENVKLKQTNDELLRELEHTSEELLLAQEQLSVLQEQSTRLHEEKEIEIYRVSEGLHRERASLLKQLDLLREMNKHLRDEKDMSYQTPRKTLDLKQRSSFSDTKNISSSVFKREDEEELTICSVRQSQVNGSPTTTGHLPRLISIEEDHLPDLLQNDCETQSPLQECSEEEEASDYEENIDLVMSSVSPCSSSALHQVSTGHVEESETPTSPRGQPVGKETSINEEGGLSPPDRLFKIVMVGNSSVGKTSLLRRFCDDCFYPGACATVGIDYSVKTISVDGSHVALQMWDTAGQERYRSITKQFFRKADGVVVMYDITSEQSFTAVRQWLTSVKESAGDDIPIMLLGNKTDKEIDRQVQRRMGESLAKDCQMTFYECSAFSGHSVVESMIHLARILKEQEDREKEKTVQLADSPLNKKKSCC
ncbi:EF-hand calcium-binding domain-containing protein 4B isoform X2 [Antennarius striatus]|uniref:EF-hand calcium-binding domain-containing protein 4B isoform X2 n=1 Tax=Antennarius striatus TaxID=241820 RepID=UPI0035B2A060